jgi:hypothetical protein
VELPRDVEREEKESFDNEQEGVDWEQTIADGLKNEA